MAITQLDWEAMRALQKATHDHLADVQWEGRDYHPRAVGWADIGTALELGVLALEAAGYRVVKA